MSQPVPERGSPRELVADVSEWLDGLYELCHGKHPNPAIDFVLDGVDELLRLRRYERCDELLRNVEVERLSIEAMLTLLMETFRAKESLSSREAFYLRVENRLRELAPERVESLLKGLR